MSTKPIAAFIFDIDGTIIDSMPYHALSWPVLFGATSLRSLGHIYSFVAQ